MKMPHIPITQPEKQMDAVCDFCKRWEGPITISVDEKDMVMMTYDYYLQHLCTPDERAQLEQELSVAQP